MRGNDLSWCAIDVGNSFLKLGIFRGGKLGGPEITQFPLSDTRALYQTLSGLNFSATILAASGHLPPHLMNYLKTKSSIFVICSSGIKLPIKISYQPPGDLGADRIAISTGAWHISQSKPVLAVSFGTCITYNLIDEQGHFIGGAISPGMHMRFKAMHQFTVGLPMVNESEYWELIGNSTIASIRSGVLQGIKAEVAEYMSHTASLFSNCKTVFCGGDSRYFAGQFKNVDFVEPELVLLGLREILALNV